MKHDFILHPLSGEPSCREYILPFKPVTVKVGEIIIGRPTFQGCPVTHVMKVIEQDKFGLIGVWMVGPQKSRGQKVRDVGHYSVIAFEGIAKGGKPVWGTRQRFLPCLCMMQMVHTGITNFVRGSRVRLESIIIM